MRPQLSSDQGTQQGDDSSDGDAIIQTAKPKVKTKAPPQHAVILHNDDYTSMEFVLEVLAKFFKKNEEEAFQIMMKVHHEGKGVAGLFTPQVAETKAAQVNDYAQAQGYPLKCTSEPV